MRKCGIHDNALAITCSTKEEADRLWDAYQDELNWFILSSLTGLMQILADRFLMR
jgi:hypothetical protein